MAGPSYNVPAPEDQTAITCLHCGKAISIARRALSVTCKYCHKPLRLEDMLFKDYQSRRSIETVGVVTIEKKANVNVVERLLCGGAIIRGRIKGNITSRGPVLVGPDAEIKGNVSAPTLAVGAGAILEGRYDIGPQSIPNPGAQASK
jgi:hypothetical protein